jgi:hypothetical protein
VVYWKDSSLSLSLRHQLFSSSRAPSKESIILRRFDGIPERKSAMEELSLIYGSRYFARFVACLQPRAGTISYLSPYPPTRPGVGCITIGSRARCTRARESFCSISISRQVNLFDAVTCQRLNLTPTLTWHKAVFTREGRNRAYFDHVNDFR